MFNELKLEEARLFFEKSVADIGTDHKLKHLVDRLLKNRASMPLLILLVAKTSKHGNLLARRTDLTKIEVVDVNSIVVLN